MNLAHQPESIQKYRSFIHSRDAQFFVSYVMEEIGGRALPGVPIKIMGHHPRIVGAQVAKLVRSRYRELKPETIESMPRTRTIAVQLKSSYLMITLEFPSDGPCVKKKSVVFSRFVTGFATEINSVANHPSSNARKHKIQL